MPDGLLAQEIQSEWVQAATLSMAILLLGLLVEASLLWEPELLDQ